MFTHRLVKIAFSKTFGHVTSKGSVSFSSSYKLSPKQVGELGFLERNKVLYTLKDYSVYFRRTFMAGFGAIICFYGAGFILTLTSLPEQSKTVDPIPLLLKWRYPLAVLFGIMGITAVGVNKFFIYRTVSSIELYAGGKTVKIQALNRIPLSKSQYTFEVPLSHISCVRSRRDTKSPFVQLKIKGKRGLFYIDKEGSIPEPELFDYSIGVYRNI